MRRINIILVFILIYNISLAQKNNCECTAVYEDLINKLEQNYIGLAQLKAKKQDALYILTIC